MRAGAETAKKEASSSIDAGDKEKKSEGSTIEDSAKAVNGMKIRPTPSNYNYLLQIENLPETAGELLGSVTFSPSGGPDSGHAVRTSARVIQKMRMDTARPPTPPPPDRKEKTKDDAVPPKPANPPPRISRPIVWSNTERNIFFEGLNEYGRDFDAITHFMNHKLKRRQPLEQPIYKAGQVRQLYYQTFHKISKYLKFSDDVRKYAQELYALINYGEMRRKLIVVNEKACMKLRDLVYRGYVTIREKGKNIRIKTPSCRALRKLNQLEEWQEEIKLPHRVEVFLVPATMESWGRVQSIAQNPRIRTSVPLQRRVMSVLKFLQNKWRTQEVRIAARASTQCHSSGSKSKTCRLMQMHQRNELREELMNAEKLLCFAPPTKTVIHRPMVNLTEFSSSYNICLNSYEERIGATVRGETLLPEKWHTHRDFIRAQKRQRHDSGSDNKSPDTKKGRAAQHTSTSADSLETAPPQISIQTIDFSAITNNQDSNIQPLIDLQEVPEEKSIVEESPPKIEPEVSTAGSVGPVKVTGESSKKKREPKWNQRRDTPTNQNTKKSFKPLISEEVIRKIKEGWTVNNVCDLTFGDLYVMFGSDFKLTLEYRWVDPPPKVESSESTIGEEATSTSGEIHSAIPVKMELPETEDFNKLLTEKPSLPGNKETESLLGRRLSQLLLISSMMDKTGRRRTTCSCGHICDKSFKIRETEPKLFTNDGALFKHPIAPPRNYPDSYRYVNVMRNNRAFRWLKPRSHRSSAFPSRQVVVQRILPLQPGVKPSYVTASVDYEEPSSPPPPSVSRTKFTNTPRSSAPTATVTTKSLMRVSKMQSETSSVVKSEDLPARKGDDAQEVNTVEEKMLKQESNDEEEEEFNIEDNPAIRSIMELSLPSLRFGFIPSATPPMSPMRIVREGSDSKWLEENMHDYSFSSLLGHLDSHLDTTCRPTVCPTNPAEENHVDSSIDYAYKFA
uniref:Polycomb-group transcriptional regulator n=2 Tax=Lutzomyia longipalpis TaxID=7200 RepID=A0A1B0GHX4_LUTLO